MPKRRRGTDASQKDSAALSSANQVSSLAAGTSASNAGATAARSADASVPNMQELLTCPVCYDIMFPPVKQCPSGHPFCKPCCAKLIGMSSRDSPAKCPICCVALGGGKAVALVPRALMLEQLASAHVVHCPEGCGASLRYGDYSRHRLNCYARFVHCPSSRCQWMGLPSTLRNHLVDQVYHGSSGCLAPLIATPHACKDESQRRCWHQNTRTLQPDRSVSFDLIFETSRSESDPRAWRPSRRLLSVYQGGDLSPEGEVRDADFLVSLWRPSSSSSSSPEGASAPASSSSSSSSSSPLLASVAMLRKPSTCNDDDVSSISGSGSSSSSSILAAATPEEGGGSVWWAELELRAMGTESGVSRRPANPYAAPLYTAVTTIGPVPALCSWECPSAQQHGNTHSSHSNSNSSHSSSHSSHSSSNISTSTSTTTATATLATNEANNNNADGQSPTSTTTCANAWLRPDCHAGTSSFSSSSFGRHDSSILLMASPARAFNACDPLGAVRYRVVGDDSNGWHTASRDRGMMWRRSTNYKDVDKKVPRLIEGTTIWAAPVKQEAGPGGGGAALSGDCDWVCARTLPPSPDRQQFGIYRQSWKSALHKDTHWPYELLYLPTKTEDGVLLLELEDDVIARANDAILPAGTRVRISHPAMDGYEGVISDDSSADMVSSGLYSVQVSEPPASNATENNHSNNSANTEPSYVSLMLGPANFTVIDDAADIAAQRARMEAAGISTATSASSASGDTSRASTHASAPEPDVTSTAGTSRTQEIADQDKLKKHKHNKVQQRYVLRVKLFRTAPFKSPPEEESTGREEGEDDEEEVPTYDGSNGESEGSEIESEGSSDEDEDSAAEEIDRQREDERWELDYPGYGGHGSEYDDDDDDDDEEDDDDDDEGSRIRGRFVEGPGTYEEEEEEEEEEEGRQGVTAGHRRFRQWFDANSHNFVSQIEQRERARLRRQRDSHSGRNHSDDNHDNGDEEDARSLERRHRGRRLRESSRRESRHDVASRSRSSSPRRRRRSSSPPRSRRRYNWEGRRHRNEFYEEEEGRRREMRRPHVDSRARNSTDWDRFSQMHADHAAEVDRTRERNGAESEEIHTESSDSRSSASFSSGSRSSSESGHRSYSDSAYSSGGSGSDSGGEVEDTPPSSDRDDRRAGSQRRPPSRRSRDDIRTERNGSSSGSSNRGSNRNHNRRSNTSTAQSSTESVDQEGNGNEEQDESEEEEEGSEESSDGALVRRRGRSLRRLTQLLGPSAAPLWRPPSASSSSSAAAAGGVPERGEEEESQRSRERSNRLRSRNGNSTGRDNVNRGLPESGEDDDDDDAPLQVPWPVVAPRGRHRPRR